MATKQIAGFGPFDHVSIEVEIKGAMVLDSPDSSTTRIRLDGVKLAEIDFPAIENVLQAADVAEDDRIFLVDQFSRQVERHLLAKALAKRISRVG